jgi:hypothetical protein
VNLFPASHIGDGQTIVLRRSSEPCSTVDRLCTTRFVNVRGWRAIDEETQ